MAGIRDVAKKAGVAKCTVSRVLNGTDYVAPQTREKIEKAMKELNYIPNELARGMFRKKAGIIAMLVTNIRHPYFASLSDAMEKKLYEKGYKMMLCSTDGDKEKEQEYINMLKSNIVDGVILGVSSLENEVYEDIRKPMVMLDYKVSENIPLVVSDHEKGGRLAAGVFLRDKRNYVISIVDAGVNKVESYKYFATMKKILEAEGIYVRGVEISWNDFDFKGYLEMAKTILTNYPQIDGIVAADMPAAAFLKAALQLGIKVPEEFSIIAYDGTFISHMGLVNMTMIVQPIDQIAEETVKILTEEIETGGGKGRECLLDVQLIEGETTYLKVSGAAPPYEEKSNGPFATGRKKK